MIVRLLVSVIVAFVGIGCAPSLPVNTPVTRAVWLDQNWSDSERYWFHHAGQGTATLPVPYPWFVSLEQPNLSFFGDPGLLVDEDYLRRFGFIPSPKSSAAPESPSYGYQGEKGRAYRTTLDWEEEAEPKNPDGLPVGFARLQNVEDPVTGATIDAVGFTCAACHTGQIEYKGVSLRIDGGPAVTDLGKFRQAIGAAVALTKYVPGRFGRFADRVLGPDHSDGAEQELEQAFDQLIAKGQKLSALEKPVLEESPLNVEEGFARLDALNRIGNLVFFRDQLVGLEPEDNTVALANLHPMTAPVAFPHIWTTSWFDWVQYDASILQPMIRNAGEAMGVSAKVNLIDPSKPLYRSTAALHQIYEMEQLLAGSNPNPVGGTKPGFNGLRPPKWPEDLLEPIDRSRAAQGAELYGERCARCHLSPVDSDAFWHARGWTPENGAGERYLVLKLIPTKIVGTDPAQAAVLVERRVKVFEHLGIDPSILGCQTNVPPGVVTETTFAAALGVVVEKTANQWYDERDIPEETRRRMNGNRPNCLQAELAYKARPLDGVWATPPFLHNGSVPNLYELLSPVAERSSEFYLGSRVFDPVRVGYETGEIDGGFLLDTRKPGNANTGHEFRDGRGEPGVVGDYLEPQERRAIVEYLKTL